MTMVVQWRYQDNEWIFLPYFHISDHWTVFLDLFNLMFYVLSNVTGVMYLGLKPEDEWKKKPTKGKAAAW